MAGVTVDRKTVVQKLGELVEWYLSDNEVELKFVPNVLRKGKHSPEFDFDYWISGRRVTEKCLGMMIMCELQRRNYNFNLAKVLSSLVECGWRHYVASQDYPPWLLNELPAVIKRPVGRPRKNPPAIKLEELNTPTPKDQD